MKNRVARKTRKQIKEEKIAISLELINKANAKDNPLEPFPQLNKHTLSDGSVIKLISTRVTEIPGETIVWIFDLMERNMRTFYEESHWGWDEHKKQTELTEESAYYLLASVNDKMIGFSHFRFDMDHNVEVLYCYELQLEPSERRKGLGQFMMKTLETMAMYYKMQKVILTVLTNNPVATAFYKKLGYKKDVTSPALSEDTDYCILSKQIPHKS